MGLSRVRRPASARQKPSIAHFDALGLGPAAVPPEDRAELMFGAPIEGVAAGRAPRHRGRRRRLRLRPAHRRQALRDSRPLLFPRRPRALRRLLFSTDRDRRRAQDERASRRRRRSRRASSSASGPTPCGCSILYALGRRRRSTGVDGAYVFRQPLPARPLDLLARAASRRWRAPRTTRRRHADTKVRARPAPQMRDNGLATSPPIPALPDPQAVRRHPPLSSGPGLRGAWSSGAGQLEPR